MRYPNRRLIVGLLLLVLAFQTTGCVTSLSLSEERTWGNLLGKGVVQEPIRFKDKGVAGVLSFIIPGVGHFYAGEPGLGVAYFLGNVLWPFSIFWTIPASLQATDVTNKRRTIEYYTLGAHSQVVEQFKMTGKLPQNFKTYEEVQGTL